MLAQYYRYKCRTYPAGNPRKQLQRWDGNVWRDYPSPAERVLLMEEAHLQHNHIGGARLQSLLA